MIFPSQQKEKESLEQPSSRCNRLDSHTLLARTGRREADLGEKAKKAAMKRSGGDLPR
jgi:hypothetical protein